MTNPTVTPKLCGADVELGNFVAESQAHEDSVREASQLLLDEIRALNDTSFVAPTRAPVPANSATAPATEHDPQDRGRTFLASNGGCAYIDLDHLELCLPETISAYDHVACWHAMLRIAQNAQAAVNTRRARRVHVLINNSDGRGHAYGSHLNVLVSRAAFDTLLYRKPHYLAYLAAFQVSSIPMTGQGKVGAESGAPRVAYQLSQRADFFETVSGVQTTAFRPLVNTRDEPLCGPYARARADLARVHIIFYDSTLCEVATMLRVGTMQIILAMIEAHAIDSTLALDDPVAAVRTWSHDPTLTATARLLSRDEVTAVQLQRRFFEAAARFVADGRAADVVPRAEEIVALWGDTLDKLEARDWAALARRLDWVLKLQLLTRAMEHRPDLRWDSTEIKHLDHLYSSLDPADGLYWSVAQAGFVDRVVSDEQIARYAVEAPCDTRARVRASLLRRAGQNVEHVDWDSVRINTANAHGVAEQWRVELPNPLDANGAAGAMPWPETWSLSELARRLGGTKLAPAVARANASHNNGTTIYWTRTPTNSGGYNGTA